MDELNKAYLSSNPVVDSIDFCSLPYIYIPGVSSNSICYIDVFYVLDKKMNLTLNASLETTIHAGEIILIIPRENDYFLLSG
ncbi:hypothetical protein KAV55_005121, partial [Salmonella enterica]|nr:hypothetical protein [Salmonella enterica]